MEQHSGHDVRSRVINEFRWINGHADVARLFRDAQLLTDTGRAIGNLFRDETVDLVAAPEARGFVLGTSVAMHMTPRLLAPVAMLALIAACQPTSPPSTTDGAGNDQTTQTGQVGEARSMPCLETDTEITSLDTKTGRWLLDVLQVVGAPGGHRITGDVITDQHGELVLDIPAYRGKFRLSMFAEPPDFENISLRDIPIVARQRPYTLHGSRFKAKTLVQQFIAAGPHVWVTVRVRPENGEIAQNDMAVWFRDYTRALKRHPVPQCLRRLAERS